MDKEKLKNEIIEIDDWYQKHFWPPVNSGLVEFQKSQFNIVTSYRNMLQQLAIVSGAIATFSMMLVPARVQVNIVLLLLGVIFLLLNTMVSFVYLFYTQRKDSKNLGDYEDKKIIPVMHIRKLYFDLLQNPTEDNLSKFKIGKEKDLKSLGDGQFDEYKKAPTDRSDITLAICFSAGIIFVILSIISPYIFK